MILYHYTSLVHLELIKQDGIIKTTESNIGSPSPLWKPYGNNIGPQVVWLTDQPEVKTGHGLDSNVVNKFQVRLKFDLPDAIRWVEFANQHGINKKWYRILDKTGNYTARHWYVLTRPIQLFEIQEIKAQ
jgi:hypothetical protein